MATTTKTSIKSVTRISGGTPKTDPIYDTSIKPLTSEPSGVKISILGVLNTSRGEIVLQINMYNTEDVESCSINKENNEQADVKMESDQSNGVAYIGVTLDGDVSTSPWSFVLELEYAKSGKKFKYQITKM